MPERGFLLVDSLLPPRLLLRTLQTAFRPETTSFSTTAFALPLTDPLTGEDTRQQTYTQCIANGIQHN